MSGQSVTEGESIVEFGDTPWTDSDMREALDSFLACYQNRPTFDNPHGMKSPHLFLMWFVLKTLKPEFVIESGVYRGMGTWFIEQACPDARIACIDIHPQCRVYTSSRAEYYVDDFSTIDWGAFDPERSLVFVDDHQNAYDRLMQLYFAGFRHVLFEDNYPPGQGDVYSLKKVWRETGFLEPRKAMSPLGMRLHRLVNRLVGAMNVGKLGDVPPTGVHAKNVRRHLEAYCELPPVYRPTVTRWGVPFDEDVYASPAPLLTDPVAPAYQRFVDEAQAYTWMCYVRLKKNPHALNG